MYKQVCIIPFKRDYLLEFNRLPQSDLEKIESVDMLRVLKTGSKVRMVPMETETFSVDTPEDLQKVIQAMANDKLISRYRN
jgi:3-deoxy-manno-octulosonate cytidylyltransferase (CMP-KDO synthetase)